MLSKRIFIGVSIAVAAIIGVSVLLLATSKPSVLSEKTVPSSNNLASLPPQANETPEYSATIKNLPLAVSYTDTRNLQETLGYLLGPGEKGKAYTATYREGSRSTGSSGSTTFLVDVESEAKTFIVTDDSTIACASQSQQKEPSWRCAITTEDL